MKKNLKDLTTIRFGFHASPQEQGPIAYLQARQFSDAGVLLAGNETYLDMDEKNQSHLLQDGDVLFVGKGFRTFAWCYRISYGPAIASSIFFVMQPDQTQVYPEYLATVFNLPQSQAYFQQLGAGSSITSIRKNELGEFKVPLLPLEQQKQIVELTRLHTQEVHLLEAILQEKKNLYTATISTLIH